MEFCILTDDEFDKFVSNHPQNNLNQSIYMVRSQRSRGLDIELVGVKSDDKVIAATSLLYTGLHFGYKICECIKGPLLDYNNIDLINFFTENIKKYLKDKGVNEIIISPYLVYKERDIQGDILNGGIDNSNIIKSLSKIGYKHNGFTPSLTNVNWMVVKDLSVYKSNEELLNSFYNRTRRAAVKNAERCGVYVEEVNKDNLDIFYDIVKNAAEAKHFQGRNREFYENLLETIDSDHVKILISCINMNDYKSRLLKLISEENDKSDAIKKRLELRSDKNNESKLQVSIGLIEKYNKSLSEIENYPAKDGILPLAGVYFFCYGSEVVAAVGGARDKYRQFDGATALYWYMMKYALNNGYKKFNFYGTFGIFDEKSPGHSIYLFKKGWGGQVVNTLGEFKLPIRPINAKLYSTFKTIRKQIHRK